MVATIGGNPPPTGTHSSCNMCIQYHLRWKGKQASRCFFRFHPKPPWYWTLQCKHCREIQGCCNSDHEPLPLHQPTPHLCLEMAHNYSNASPPSSTHTVTIKKMKNIKTTHATTPNKHTSTNRNTMTKRRLPPFQPMTPTHATPLPYMPITVPPQYIDFDVLKASILSGLNWDTTTLQKMMPTTQPMPMTQPTMMPQQMTTTPKNTKTTANKMTSNPTKSTVNATTLPKPQQLPQTTTDATDAPKTMLQQWYWQWWCSHQCRQPHTTRPQRKQRPATLQPLTPPLTNHNNCCNLPTMTRNSLEMTSRHHYRWWRWPSQQPNTPQQPRNHWLVTLSPPKNHNYWHNSLPLSRMMLKMILWWRYGRRCCQQWYLRPWTLQWPRKQCLIMPQTSNTHLTDNNHWHNLPATLSTMPKTCNQWRQWRHQWLQMMKGPWKQSFTPQPIHCHQLHPQQPTTNATAQCWICKGCRRWFWDDDTDATHDNNLSDPTTRVPHLRL